MKASVLSLALLLPAAGFAANSGKKIQCWTDQQGHRACGDSVPAQYMDRERDVIDQRGYVVEKKERPKTPEEQAAEAREKAQAEEALKQRRRQAEYDRFLLQTYASAQELEQARDLRLQVLDNRIRLVEKALADSEGAAGKFQAHLDALEKDGKPVTEAQRKQLRDYQRLPAENRQALVQLQNERAEVVSQFGRDIARFQELKQASARP